MTAETSTDVLVVGAGPVGLTAACELRRHGVDCRIVDRLTEPPQYAKAVGVQPRTIEIWEDMGLERAALDAATKLDGLIVYVDGEQVSRFELVLPPDIPYQFFALPQYETERLLTEHLAMFGTHVERGVELRSFEQDADGVTCILSGPAGDETVRAGYLVGCDGAHSAVRHGLGLSFEGGAFPEEYMLGDVVVDWSFPHGYGLRILRHADDGSDDLLVCIPLPGDGRYRMTMVVPPELATPPATGDAIEHGFEAGRPTPTLADIQSVIDRLSPEPATARELRWSSLFRISHRIVDRYSSERAFVCGDAAHIHPPTGAQGMNTGIQDAYNLAWKLALAVRGEAAEGLLESYDAERRPIGEEVVGRTVKSARSNVAERSDPASMLLREGQLLIGYPDSPIVSEGAGERAPDVYGLRRDGVSVPVRLFELLRGPTHTLLVAGAGEEAAALIAEARERAHGRLTAYSIGDGAGAPGAPAIRDPGGTFAQTYGLTGTGLVLVRPDGYIGFRSDGLDRDGLLDALGRVFA